MEILNAIQNSLSQRMDKNENLTILNNLESMIELDSFIDNASIATISKYCRVREVKNKIFIVDNKTELQKISKGNFNVIRELFNSPIFSSNKTFFAIPKFDNKEKDYEKVTVKDFIESNEYYILELPTFESYNCSADRMEFNMYTYNFIKDAYNSNNEKNNITGLNTSLGILTKYKRKFDLDLYDLIHNKSKGTNFVSNSHYNNEISITVSDLYIPVNKDLMEYIIQKDTNKELIKKLREIKKSTSKHFRVLLSENGYSYLKIKDLSKLDIPKNTDLMEYAKVASIEWIESLKNLNDIETIKTLLASNGNSEYKYFDTISDIEYLIENLKEKDERTIFWNATKFCQNQIHYSEIIKLLTDKVKNNSLYPNLKNIYLSFTYPKKEVFEQLIELCNQLEINLIGALPYEFCSKHLCFFDGAFIQKENKKFTHHILSNNENDNLLNRFVYGIQKSYYHKEIYHKIKFTDKHIPFKKIYKSNRVFFDNVFLNHKYFQIKANTGLGKTFAVKTFLAALFKKLGYVCIFAAPRNVIVEQQSDKNKYIAFTSDNNENAIFKTNLHDGNVYGNIVLSNFDNLELAINTVLSNSKKYVLFIDESDQTIKDIGFRPTQMQNVLDCIKASEKTIFISATPIEFDGFKDNTFFLELERLPYYYEKVESSEYVEDTYFDNSIDGYMFNKPQKTHVLKFYKTQQKPTLMLSKQVDYIDNLTTLIPLQTNLNKRVIVFLDDIKKLQIINKALRKNGIKSYIVASKNITDRQKLEQDTIFVGAKFEWNTDIKVILTTQKLSAGVNIETDRNTVVYCLNLLKGFDNNKLLQDIGRVRNFDKFEVEYFIITNPQKYFRTNPFLGYGFDYLETFEQSKLHTQMQNTTFDGLKEKYNIDYALTKTNNIAKELFTEYSELDKKYIESETKIYFEKFNNLVENGSPYFLDLKEIINLDSNEICIDTKKENRKIAKFDKDTQTQIEKNVCDILKSDFTNFVSIIQFYTKEPKLKLLLTGIVGNPFEFKFDVKLPFINGKEILKSTQIKNIFGLESLQQSKFKLFVNNEVCNLPLIRKKKLSLPISKEKFDVLDNLKSFSFESMELAELITDYEKAHITVMENFLKMYFSMFDLMDIEITKENYNNEKFKNLFIEVMKIKEKKFSKVMDLNNMQKAKDKFEVLSIMVNSLDKDFILNASDKIVVKDYEKIVSICTKDSINTFELLNLYNLNKKLTRLSIESFLERLKYYFDFKQVKDNINFIGKKDITFELEQMTISK